MISVQGTGEPPAGQVMRSGLELDLDVPRLCSEPSRGGYEATPIAQAPRKV